MNMALYMTAAPSTGRSAAVATGYHARRFEMSQRRLFSKDKRQAAMVPVWPIRSRGRAIAGGIVCYKEGSQEASSKSAPSRFKDPGSLYNRLGGAAAVGVAVAKFYGRMMADDRMRPFFAGVDMKRQLAKQTAFLSFAFGGAESYKGKPMYPAHKRLIDELGMRFEHVDIVVAHLSATLQEMGVPKDMVEEVATIVYKAAPSVFGEDEPQRAADGQ